MRTGHLQHFVFEMHGWETGEEQSIHHPFIVQHVELKRNEQPLARMAMTDCGAFGEKRCLRLTCGINVLK